MSEFILIVILTRNVKYHSMDTISICSCVLDFTKCSRNSATYIPCLSIIAPNAPPTGSNSLCQNFLTSFLFLAHSNLLLINLSRTLRSNLEFFSQVSGRKTCNCAFVLLSPLFDVRSDHYLILMLFW